MNTWSTAYVTFFVLAALSTLWIITSLLAAVAHPWVALMRRWIRRGLVRVLERISHRLDTLRARITRRRFARDMGWHRSWK